MRVVVTGGTGRAGRWVVRHLAETGHEVVNFDVVNRPELGLPGDFCRVDLAHAGKVYDALFQFRPEGIFIWRRIQRRAVRPRSMSSTTTC